MKKLNEILLLLCILAVSFTGSCVSSSGVKVEKAFDYTEDDAVADELIKIQKLLGTNSVLAMWRASLIVRNVPSNETASGLLEECFKVNENLFSESLEKKNFIEALRLYKSLASCGYKGLSGLKENEASLMALMKKNVPGFSGSSSGVKKVSERIKGTVTVYVDKGIKIERGYGYTDAVLGSGFFISSDGYIVTNHHVISDCVDPKYEGFSRLYVKIAEDPDTRIPARVIGWDSSLDIALIKAETDAPYVFELGSSQDLDVGTEVYAIGSPLGLDKTITRGIISATDRRLLLAAKVFQLDAAVNSGNSGGPLIDEDGKVLAIVFAGVQNYQGLNFAIPVEYLKSELPFLYAGGERVYPWMGAWGKTRRLSGSGVKSEGVELFYAMPGGSAFRAGLKMHQTIVEFDSRKIESLDDLQAALMSCPEKTVVTLSVRNEDDAVRKETVYLERRPENPGYEVYRHDLIEDAMLPIVGMSMVHSSASDSKKFMVTYVVKSSQADDAGFSETDPVELYGIDVNKEHSAAVIQLYAKRHKKGFLDVPLILTCPLDSPYYF